MPGEKHLRGDAHHNFDDVNAANLTTLQVNLFTDSRSKDASQNNCTWLA